MSNDTRVRWLVVGLGDVALRRVLPAIAADPHSVLHGVVTREPAKAAAHAPRAWTELAEALHDAAIDAVYIATPNFLHAPQALAALAAGRHVLCEKPAALNHTEAATMVAAARAARRLLGIAYFRRYYPKLRRARELLAQGAIGKPRLAFAACSEWVRPEREPRQWLFDPRRAGSGPLHDIGSHRIDALNFLLGQPTHVAARFRRTGANGEVEDSASLLIDYAGGARAMLDARWDTQVALDDCRIIGDKGELDLTPLSGPRLRPPGAEELLPCAPNRHLPCIANFAAAVLGQEPLHCSAEDCLPAAWVLEQALRSAGST